MAAITSQTEQLLRNHLHAFARGDVDAILADYADDAVLFTPEGALRGKKAIRPLLDDLVAELPPGTEIEIRNQIVDGELAYVVWSAETEKVRVPLAIDTLIIENSKIARQTFAAQVEEKK